MRNAPRRRNRIASEAPAQSISDRGRMNAPSLLTMLATHWEKVLGVAGVGLAAAIGIWLDPLKDFVLHKIYHEQAEIALLLSEGEFAPGSTVNVRVRVTPTSKINTADGIVKLTYDSRFFSLAPNSQDSFNVKRSDQARIFDEGTFILFVKSHKDTADTQLQATYTTKFGNHVSPEVKVKLPAQKRDTVFPYIERSGSKEIHLSGEWRIQLGASQGTMKVRQDPHNNVEGEYWFTESDTKVLPQRGYKDGTAYKVFFWRDVKGSQRWFIDANFDLNKQDPRFVEMNGCAFLIVQDAAITHDSPVPVPKSDMCARRDFVGWRGVGASIFYATAQMQQP